ncbi:MAG TPA: chromosomal replication initiator protein DnaA [Desulfotomaculum sp.]|nr:MAG: chromosomal replication initiation protein [Peptococcaceae bacterium BRH_c8a]KJS70990.1 MAG: chromosomal replication initiation protein [Desulfotomaculum sp. BICA1-6]HBX23908.1 chromosomal replication initiator protein DnaA [Desulfotomaculum sp.]
MAIWDKTVAQLKNALNTQSYETWIIAMQPVAIKNNIFYIGVPDHFSKDWLNNSYAPLFKDIISQIINVETSVQFILHDEYNRVNNDRKEQHPTDNELKNSTLNPRFTFDNFVVGNSNRFAHAACLAVAESPAKAYNPLFIYGGVGLGKTHLMHAIGHMIREKNSHVAYVTSEKFTNDLINAIREEKTVDFKNKYRGMDILLIDDIQFLAGKERTQEEFFHTFNTLYEANKQIIISSDRPPKEIPTLEDRLRSRFEWGLITDIQMPDYETRIAILQKKAQVENLHVSDEVINFIADRINSNIRELEGALIRVSAYSALTDNKMDRQTAAEVLKDILPAKKPVQITVPLIQQKVAEYFGVKIEDMKSKKRSRVVSFPRQVAMYLCRELTDNSLPKIGKLFGDRDHTTVMHAQDKISQEIEKDPAIAQAVNKIREVLQQS